MAIRDLLVTMLRRWYIVLAALLCSALLAAWFAQDQRVFTTRTAISFTYPNSSALDPYNGGGDKSVISFVSAIVEKVNKGESPSVYADLSAPYYGAGIRQGVSVSLPNEGGQFIAIYRQAQIDIQIVGPSEAWVQEKQSRIVSEVFAIADDMQTRAGALPSERILPTVAPLTLAITSVAPNRSALILALVGLGIAGLLAGGWGAVAVDRPRARRRRELTDSAARPHGGRLMEDSIV